MRLRGGYSRVRGRVWFEARRVRRCGAPLSLRRSRRPRGTLHDGRRPEFSLAFSRTLGRVVVQIHGPLDVNNAQELDDRLADVIDGQGNRQLVLISPA